MNYFRFTRKNHNNSEQMTILNDGQDLVHTNYWESGQAKAGICFLSGNAGALRLLVPSITAESSLDEMRTGKRVNIEKSILDPRCVDIVFEDGSTAPFFISIDRTSTDCALKRGRKVPFSVWTPLGKVLSLKARINKIRP